MLRLKNLIMTVLFLAAFVFNSFALASEWISFGSSYEKQKPTARVLVSNDQETIIEFTLHGMDVKDS